jgi:hypothetical protein
MKRTIIVVLLLLCGISASAAAGSDFDKLKGLVGQWDATSPEGKTRITFQLISEGSALMESMARESMVTVYHQDGDSIMMTHYCSAGNQPRMRVRRSLANEIAFEFVDAANLKGSADGRMQRLLIKFQDKDHVTEEWTWKVDGKETTTVFHLQRVK